MHQLIWPECTCPRPTAKVSQVCVTSPVRFSISAILGIDKLEAVGPARTSIYVYQNLNFDFYHFLIQHAQSIVCHVEIILHLVLP